MQEKRNFTPEFKRQVVEELLNGVFSTLFRKLLKLKR